MKIKEMPWYTQPWTRVANDGVSAMNDAELLAAGELMGVNFLNHIAIGKENYLNMKEKGVII